MEPIFEIYKFTTNKNFIRDSEIFRNGTMYFFSQPKNQTLENAYYHFGLMFDSIHIEKNTVFNKEIFKPFKELFPNTINTDLLLAVQLGKDLQNHYDEVEADKFDSYYWRIIKAKEFKRPDWAFYMFMGNVQGLFNSGRIRANRLIEYLNLFPKTFIDKHKIVLQFNFNYFDERGYMLTFGQDVQLDMKGECLYHGIIEL